MNIKELAEQAGANVLETSAWTIIQLNTGDQTKFLERFAELVAAAERESCARLVEEVGRQTAEAIRARSK